MTGVTTDPLTAPRVQDKLWTPTTHRDVRDWVIRPQSQHRPHVSDFFEPRDLLRTIFNYCITRYFRGRKISRKVNLRYIRGKIFSRICWSRENIFPRKYLLAKIIIFPRKYLPAKISSPENIFSRFFFLPRLFGLLFRNIYLGLPKSSWPVDSVLLGSHTLLIILTLIQSYPGPNTLLTLTLPITIILIPTLTITKSNP